MSSLDLLTFRDWPVIFEFLEKRERLELVAATKYLSHRVAQHLPERLDVPDYNMLPWYSRPTGKRHTGTTPDKPKQSKCIE